MAAPPSSSVQATAAADPIPPATPRRKSDLVLLACLVCWGVPWVLQGSLYDPSGLSSSWSAYLFYYFIYIFMLGSFLLLPNYPPHPSWLSPSSSSSRGSVANGLLRVALFVAVVSPSFVPESFPKRHYVIMSFVFYYLGFLCSFLIAFLKWLDACYGLLLCLVTGVGFNSYSPNHPLWCNILIPSSCLVIAYLSALYLSLRRYQQQPTNAASAVAASANLV